MTAYLDYGKAEDERVKARVTKEIGDDFLRNRRKGMKDILGRVLNRIIISNKLYT